MRRLFLGAVLVAVWMLLWGDLTWGQLVAGVLVAGILLVLLPSSPGDLDSRLIVRPVPLARLVGWFVWQFVLSNAYVVRAVVMPKRYVNSGVVRVPLRATSPALAALVSNITALTPGMQPVDGRPDGSVVDVHVLSLGTEEGVNRVVQRLEDLVLAAFDRDADPSRLQAGDEAHVGRSDDLEDPEDPDDLEDPDDPTIDRAVR